ncbi:MAG: TetR/AcrR family transcriptional regulator [Xanthomonadales bacterium]|nr:TetR/AcrR family transcriptional regulator [Xanthomonadales bacterium]
MIKFNQDNQPAVRPARQARSAKTRDAILKVVERRIRDGSFETATVQQIVNEANSSVGAFYGRFSDKTAALYSFYEDRCEALESSVAELFKPKPADDVAAVLARFIDFMVRHTMKNEPFLRASRPYFSSAKETPFQLRARQLNSRLYQHLLGVLQRHREDFGHPEPETAALFLLALIGGLTRDALLTGKKLTRQKMYAEAFISELERAVFGYLGVSSQPEQFHSSR